MNTEFEHLDRIEQYLNGTFTQKEQAEFEKELNSNEQLAKEYADFIAIQTGLEAVEEEQLRKDIQTIHATLQSENFFDNTTKIKSIMENKTKKNQSGMGRILAIAASVALLIGAAYFFTQESSPSRADLMVNIDVKPDVEFANRMLEKSASKGFADPEKGKKDTIALIANFYKKGAYKTAIEVINEYIERYSPDFDTEYMLGSCLFQEGEYAKAVKHFLPLLEQKNAEQKQDIQWMTALSYLQFNSASADSNAKKILKQMLTDPGSYEPQAIEQYIEMLN